MKTMKISIEGPLGIGIMTIALLGVGCASTYPPSPHLTAEMAKARTALEQAEEVGASEYAPLALHNAKQKMEDAQTALAEGKAEEAERLSQQALVDAELAVISARSAKAQEAAQALQDSLRTLREEIRRKQNN